MRQFPEHPSVTIAIPTFNEETNIARVLQGFLNSGYKNIVQILVADGGSSDKTREIVAEFSAKDARISLVPNPDKIQALGLNRALESAQGEIFLRADAHTIYGDDYVEKCVHALVESKAINAGGAQRFIYKNVIQAGIALGSVSLFGSGMADYRRFNRDTFTDTVYLGCFVTEDLRNLGGYRNLAINEDYDLNTRIRKQNPKGVFLSKEIKAFYYPRNSFSALFKQYFGYGRNKRKTSKENRDYSIRSLVPPFVFLGVFISVIVDAFTPATMFSHFVIGALLSAMIISILIAIPRFLENQRESGNSASYFFPIIMISSIWALIIQNVAFSLGYLKAVFEL